MKLTKILGLITSAAILLGCKTMTPAELKPALLEASSSNAKLLSTAMSTLLNGTKVNVGSDTFITKHQATLERVAQDTLGQEGMNGRIMGIPEAHSFTLMTDGKTCYLIYEKTGEQLSVDGLECQSI